MPLIRHDLGRARVVIHANEHRGIGHPLAQHGALHDFERGGVFERFEHGNLNGDRLGREVCEREYRAHALERLFRLSSPIDTKTREITLAMRRKHRHKPQQANVIRITFCHLLNQVYAVTVFRHLTSRILRASADSAEATAAR